MLPGSSGGCTADLEALQCIQQDVASIDQVPGQAFQKADRRGAHRMVEFHSPRGDQLLLAHERVAGKVRAADHDHSFGLVAQQGELRMETMLGVFF